MNTLRSALTKGLSNGVSATGLLAAILLATLSQSAAAIPLFARQTGQNCVACHAGGQFPELTPYGRLFKLTGYTVGERTLPVSAMAVLTYSKVANTSKTTEPAADFQKNGSLILPTASLFLGGKITDNIGGFAQITYDAYAAQSDDGAFHGHSNADNIDLRYADRFIDPSRDLIFGVSLNNNPSLADPWNSVAAWMQYVPVPSPTSSQFIDGNAPYPGFAAGGNIAGITAYAYWNRTVYAELGAYRTAKGLLRFMSAGVPDGDLTQLKGLNPYWRLAFNREWGAHNLMVGTSGMVARAYDDPLDTSNASTTHRDRDLGVDAQYQYLLDPHSVTAQFAHTRNRHRYADASAQANTTDSTNITRTKLTYVYQATYGGSVGSFDLTGTTNTTTRGWTSEAFWTPLQYLRVGAQYTAYSRFDGAATNYNGLGRNARDNNTLFLYAWGAY
jgi:hypothetical protein